MDVNNGSHLRRLNELLKAQNESLGSKNNEPGEQNLIIHKCVSHIIHTTNSALPTVPAHLFCEQCDCLRTLCRGLLGAAQSDTRPGDQHPGALGGG